MSVSLADWIIQRESSLKRRNWSREENAVFAIMWRMGTSVAVMSEVLGRSLQAIYQHRYGLRLEPRYHTWTTYEIRLLHTWDFTRRVAETEIQFQGRSIHAIRRARARHQGGY